MTRSTQMPSRIWITLATLDLAVLAAGAALAHTVTEDDAGYVQEVSGLLPILFNPNGSDAHHPSSLLCVVAMP